VPCVKYGLKWITSDDEEYDHAHLLQQPKVVSPVRTRNTSLMTLVHWGEKEAELR
jgi:hypothetical protein